MIETTKDNPIDPAQVEVHLNDLPHEDHRVPERTPVYGLQRLVKWIIPVAVLLLGALAAISGFLQKWLWMRQLKYAGIFWTIVYVKWGMMCVAFLGALVFLWINIRHASKENSDSAEDSAKPRGGIRKTRGIEIRGVPISHRTLTSMVAAIMVAIAGVFAVGLYSQWDTYLRFHYGGSFGVPDPIFGADLGFYVFRLPFYQLLQSSFVFLTSLAIIAVCLEYAYFGLLRVTARRTVEIR